jgi:hypothetical protein
MKLSLRLVIVFAVVFAATVVGPSIASAQNPPTGTCPGPSCAIFDLSTTNSNYYQTHPLTAYTQFLTSFVADRTGTEDVSFAFREIPAYFAFDDAQVYLSTAPSINLLTDPGFESASNGQNCNHNNSLGCPPGWSAWIQPVDVSAIGQVATNSAHYGCNVNATGGTNYWCDGSVEGYDAIFQPVTVVNGLTYDISFWLEDDSSQNIYNPGIDMLVYAGDNIPGGTQQIGNTPEPLTFALVGLGLAVLGFRRRRVS